VTFEVADLKLSMRSCFFSLSTLTLTTVTLIFVTDVDDNIESGKGSRVTERKKTMKTNEKNRTSNIGNLVYGTIAACFGIPLIAAAVVPSIYLPIVCLIVPFLAAGVLESRLENIGYRVEPHHA
jgi:hypothetical protein